MASSGGSVSLSTTRSINLHHFQPAANDITDHGASRDHLLDDRDAEIERLKDGVAAYRRSESRMAELVYKLQQQLRDRDNHIAALEEQNKNLLQEKCPDDQEVLEDRGVADLVEMLKRDLSEGDLKHQSEIQALSQQHQEQLAQRDQVYQKDLEELRNAIHVIKAEKNVASQAGVLTPGGSQDLEATCREATCPDVSNGHNPVPTTLKTQSWAGEIEASARNLDAIISSRDAELKELEEMNAAQAARILELEAQDYRTHGAETEAQLRELHDVWSNAAETEAQLRELQQLAVAREAHIAEKDTTFSELQKLSAAQGARIKELEDQLVLSGSGKSGNGSGISDMEEQLGKLLELASARITELENQQDHVTNGTVAEMELQLHELKEVAMRQAKHIAELEAQDLRMRADDRSSKAAKSEADLITVNMDRRHLGSVLDSEESTSAGSGEIPDIHRDCLSGGNTRMLRSPMPATRASRNVNTAIAQTSTLAGSVLVPGGSVFVPGAASTSAMKSTTGSVLMSVTRREVSPVRRTLSPIKRDRSPLRSFVPAVSECLHTAVASSIPQAGNNPVPHCFVAQIPQVAPTPLLGSPAVVDRPIAGPVTPMIYRSAITRTASPTRTAQSQLLQGVQFLGPQQKTNTHDTAAYAEEDASEKDRQIAIGLSKKLVPL